MVGFGVDVEVDSITPEKNLKELGRLISYLCAESVQVEKLSTEAEQSIKGFLQLVRTKKPKNIRLSYQEFNELLLLFNQDRVERPFFNFFFLGDSRKEKSSLTFQELKKGVTKFRGFALLCFGNFRFALWELSQEKSFDKFKDLLSPWNAHSPSEKEQLTSRQEPLTPLISTEDEIEGEATWLLGYLSGSVLESDGETLKNLTADSSAGTTENSSQFTEWANRLGDLKQLQEEARNKGKRNTVKYLTWDFLDVYVATSMREKWEFEETNGFIDKLFKKELKNLPGIRWFDPTQSYCDSVIDKGLVEALMLKRAKCTIYMAQETDTLGKDSELAATLAQGKPVIAYVPRIEPKDLEECAQRIASHPLVYFRQRLLVLLAEQFFERPDNREKLSYLADSMGFSVSPEEVGDKVQEYLKLCRDYQENRRCQLISDEEAEFREAHSSKIQEMAKFMAVVLSRAADNRADVIRTKHPLAMQVHLASGVSNGVLVARTARECGDLVRGILLRDLSFDIEQTPKEDAIILVEKETRSSFRVVTKDECLTNSFWNFYLN